MIITVHGGKITQLDTSTRRYLVRKTALFDKLVLQDGCSVMALSVGVEKLALSQDLFRPRPSSISPCLQRW